MAPKKPSPYPKKERVYSYDYRNIGYLFWSLVMETVSQSTDNFNVKNKSICCEYREGNELIIVPFGNLNFRIYPYG